MFMKTIDDDNDETEEFVFNPQPILDFWRKDNPGGWGTRLPNPFDAEDHLKRRAGLSQADLAEFEKAWDSMLDRFADKIVGDSVVQEALDTFFGA